MFYVTDPVDINWSIVLLTNKKLVNDIDNQATDDDDDDDDGIEDGPFFGTSLPIVGEREDVVYVRKDRSDK